jgi:hypothetical protein
MEGCWRTIPTPLTALDLYDVPLAKQGERGDDKSGSSEPPHHGFPPRVYQYECFVPRPTIEVGRWTENGNENKRTCRGGAMVVYVPMEGR